MDDIGKVLYESLSTDKYGRWVEVFGKDQLHALCDRIEEEIVPHINEEIGELEDSQNDFELLLSALARVGLGWDDRDKQIVVTDYFELNVKQLRI